MHEATAPIGLWLYFEMGAVQLCTATVRIRTLSKTKIPLKEHLEGF